MICDFKFYLTIRKEENTYSNLTFLPEYHLLLG